MTASRKKIISVKIEDISLYDLDGPLDDAIEYLVQVYKRLTETHPGCDYTLSVEQDQFDPERQVIGVYTKRQETDEEYSARVDGEKQAKEWRRRQYLRLKEEFENE